MLFKYVDADGGTFILSKEQGTAIDKVDLENFAIFVTTIINARQEDVIIKSAYDVIEGDDENDDE